MVVMNVAVTLFALGKNAEAQALPNSANIPRRRLSYDVEQDVQKAGGFEEREGRNGGGDGQEHRARAWKEGGEKEMVQS